VRGVLLERFSNAAGIVNDAVDLIILRAAGVREDDQLAQQSQRENLYTQYDKQSGEQQSRAIRQRTMKCNPLEHEIKEFQHADRQYRDAGHAKETQGPLGEAHEKENGEDIEEATHVAARWVRSGTQLVRRLTHGNLRDPKTLALGEHRQESILIAV
jgi:hypothetical protein